MTIHQTQIPPSLAQLNQRLLTVEEYHRMAEAGILTEDDRVELLAGMIIPMSPIGSRHSTCVKRINQLFHQHYSPNEAVVGVQDPIELLDTSEPEPDVTLVLPPLEKYQNQHPKGADIILIVEVADSSYEKDQEVKVPLYAAAAIPEVWLVDLQKDCIEVYTEPKDGAYSLRRLIRRGESLALPIKEQAVPVEDVLGSAKK